VLTLYNVFIRLYYLGIRTASRWNKKAADWVEGRKTVFEQLEKSIRPGDAVVWMHCSSAGEFEQGKPLLEALKKTYPHKKILVSFFSPSGYRAATNYAFADVITYLPLDTPAFAKQFFKLVQPELVIFVKYEFWYHHLAVAAFHQVPILLVSASFRQNQVFFKRHGRFFRHILHLFHQIFVQDNDSVKLLQSVGLTTGRVSGDTRFDRVLTITEDNRPIAYIADFINNQNLIVAGSTWLGDEEILAHYMKQRPAVKLILVPHEVDDKHIASLLTHFENAILYSALLQHEEDLLDLSRLQNGQVLIIDTVGLLSRLYRYATLTYVGGGFTKDGIHNVLEAAVWGKPVVFGPNYQKYREGGELVESGGAYSIRDASSFKRLADDLLVNKTQLQEAGLKARTYVEENTGATGKIMAYIQENRLLTRL
jgi:3-deoxy-D-manno-octulosonic-acid transferase